MLAFSAPAQTALAERPRTGAVYLVPSGALALDSAAYLAAFGAFATGTAIPKDTAVYLAAVEAIAVYLAEAEDLAAILADYDIGQAP